MKYLSVTETAKKWNISERSVRNYCALGKVDGAFLTGKTWNIPEDAQKPDRVNKKVELPTRYYNSKDSRRGVLGNCFLHNYQISLEKEKNGTMKSFERISYQSRIELLFSATQIKSIRDKCSHLTLCHAISAESKYLAGRLG